MLSSFIISLFFVGIILMVQEGGVSTGQYSGSTRSVTLGLCHITGDSVFRGDHTGGGGGVEVSGCG